MMQIERYSDAATMMTRDDVIAKGVERGLRRARIIHGIEFGVVPPNRPGEHNGFVLHVRPEQEDEDALVDLVTDLVKNGVAFPRIARISVAL